jgi:hypothetical protein
MAWQLRGQLIENCSCNVFCPCWFGVQEYMIMDQGWCGGLIALRIEEGDSEGLDLSGRTATLAIHFPGPTMFDGGATARVYVDGAANDDQRAELEAIVQGKKGGPMEPIAALISSWLPTETASIQVGEEGDNVSIAVGDTGEVRSQLLRDPEGNAFTMRGGGFIGGFGLPEVEIAPAGGGQWADADLPTKFETKSGARGAFVWSD